MTNSTQFQLFFQRRFFPYFCTLYLGAFNDNIYKNSLLGLITFGVINTTMDLSLLNNLGALLFILPFFIFSGVAGQIADKYERSKLIRYIKLSEIAIMCGGAICFYLESISGLLILLFLMGSQSAFFGPVKYSIIPQHVNKDELVGANGLVEMGTFLAILTGTIMASYLVLSDNSIQLVCIAIISLSTLGYIASHYIPESPAPNHSLDIVYNPLTSNWRAFSLCAKDKKLLMANLAISWFWFLGASYLTQIYVFTKDHIGGDQTVVMLLLTAFSVGIAMGSLCCEKLTRNRGKLAVAFLGGIALSISGWLIVLLAPDKLSISPPQADVTTPLISIGEFIMQSNNVALLVSFAICGMCGGVFIVPIYAAFQQRVNPSVRARVISSINLMSALFMVLSAVYGIIVIVVLGFSIPQFFASLTILNALFLVLLAMNDRAYIGRQ